MKNQITLPVLTLLFLVPASYPAQAQEYWVAPSSEISLEDLCDDVVGNNTESDFESSRIAHSNSQEQSRSRDFFDESISSRNSNGRGGISIFGFGLNGGGGSERNNESRNRSRDHFDYAEDESFAAESIREQSSSTAVVAGQNCSTVVNTMGQVESVRLQEETNRMAIEAQERRHRQEIEHESRQNRMQFLMDW
jgi:hypothetical protein